VNSGVLYRQVTYTSRLSFYGLTFMPKCELQVLLIMGGRKLGKPAKSGLMWYCDGPEITMLKHGANLIVGDFWDDMFWSNACLGEVCDFDLF